MNYILALKNLRLLVRIFISITLLLSCLALRLQEGGDIIWHEDVRLVWENFNGRVPQGHNMGAASNLDILAGIEPITSEKAKCYVEAVFDCNKSWVREVHRHDENLLQHEQLHFDIQECAARDMRLVLSSGIEYSNINSEYLKNIRDSVKAVWQVVQDNYDYQTNYSLNANQQENWNRKVDSLLSVSSDYSESSFYINVR